MPTVEQASILNSLRIIQLLEESLSPTSRFLAANSDLTSSTTLYYGFLALNGNWYILQDTVSGSVHTYTYAAGLTNYSASWTGRASLSYYTPDQAFNIFPQ